MEEPVFSPQDLAQPQSQPQSQPQPQVVRQADPIVYGQTVMPSPKPQRVKVESNVDPEQQRKEDEKLRQLAEFKRKRDEEKKNPKPV